ncbi:MAG: alanine racemase [Myxococcales bacterium]|nr:MAG: alanine racemase [Myxococcales bacterium]
MTREQSTSARDTWIEVDLKSILRNYQNIKSKTDPAKVYAVIKANAYGHGILEVATWLEKGACDGFCVALVEEGLLLREHGIRTPIIVLNGIYGKTHQTVIDYELTPVVYRMDDAQCFDLLSQQKTKIHLKVDTGMARLGVRAEELETFIEKLKTLKNLQVEGLMTHMSSPWTDTRETERQIASFIKCKALLRKHGYEPSLCHVANSETLLKYNNSHFDLVRPGISLYGIGDGLHPAMRLVSSIVSIRTVPKGSAVGYNQSFVTNTSSRIATIGIGYGDGVPRRLSNRGQVLIQGKRCPIVGAVSMDLLNVDLSSCPEASIGDEVVIFGQQKDAFLGVEEVAQLADTIPYEILVQLLSRVPRMYKIS